VTVPIKVPPTAISSDMLVAEADDSIAKVAAMTKAKIESLFLLTGVLLLIWTDYQLTVFDYWVVFYCSCTGTADGHEENLSKTKAQIIQLLRENSTQRSESANVDETANFCTLSARCLH
jgi:hypothetical protein